MWSRFCDGLRVEPCRNWSQHLHGTCASQQAPQTRHHTSYTSLTHQMNSQCCFHDPAPRDWSMETYEEKYTDLKGSWKSTFSSSGFTLHTEECQFESWRRSLHESYIYWTTAVCFVSDVLEVYCKGAFFKQRTYFRLLHTLFGWPMLAFVGSSQPIHARLCQNFGVKSKQCAVSGKLQAITFH